MTLKNAAEKVYRIGTEDYKVEISDHILDSQYGQIGLTEVERRIERLSIFKRLHNISQLGLVNWIFPCALHTRYTHSLGVMHVANQMALHINSNVGHIFFDESDIQIIRLAAMLHDIGHYPMSHNVEQAYKDIEKNKKLRDDLVIQHLDQYVNCPDYLNPFFDSASYMNMGEKDQEKQEKASNEEKFLKDFSGSRGFHHERIGMNLITNNKNIEKIVKEHFVLMRDTLSGEKVVNPKFCNTSCEKMSEQEVNKVVSTLLEAIGNMVIGNYAYEFEQDIWLEKYSAMIQLIHSDIDADNLDYLLRDASFSGTSYGIMDMGQLMNALTVSTIKYDDNKKYLVGIKKKGIGCVEQFFLNKYLAYSQMTLSKYVSILEAMLLKVVKQIISGDYAPRELQNMTCDEEDKESYLAFVDAYIIREIYSFNHGSEMLSGLYKAIISRLKNYSAFELSKNYNENESLCTGFSEEYLMDEMGKSTVYQRFVKVCEEIKSKTGRNLGDDESRLFSFRFEQYSLTKQIPIDSFLDSYDLFDMDDRRRFSLHYYRLATGVPILESNKEYEYEEEENTKKACKDSLPQMIVDCPQSLINKLYSMRFVSLREYAVEEYTVCA